MRFDGPPQPRKKVYYYRNHHGKVIALNEDVAFEQHHLHPEYLGSSEDLIRTGYDPLEAIAKHLKENVSNPAPPPDKRKVTNYTERKPDINISQLREQIKQELLREIQYGIRNEKQKTENEGVNRGDDQTSSGETA